MKCYPPKTYPGQIVEMGTHRIRKKHGHINRVKLHRLFLLAFIIWFSIFVHKASSDTLGVDIKSQPDTLVKIKKELDEKRKSMEKLNRKEKSTYEELLDLEERLDSTQRLKRNLASKEKEVEKELEIEDLSLAETDSSLSCYRQLSLKRLREIYKHKRFRPFTLIFEDSSPVEMVNRIKFTQRILKEDQNLLRKTKNLKVNLEEKKRNLTKTKSELSGLRTRKAEEESDYQKELTEKEKLLKKIKSEKKLYAQALEELTKSASELENILAQIHPPASNEIETKEEGLFGISKGKLPWPISGKVIAYFGEQKNSQFLTKTKNSGIEIESEPGKEVVAVADGRVVYSSNLRGYGNIVILEHEGGYYTLYARLSEILVSSGEEVDRLQKIGVVGESGLFFTPGLHFEIRKGKQPQDPLKWLR